ncbi:MAG: helix-turn-helix domain-containing protein [Oscillospiraceae bacterium]|nr:helix-turn-helix domain-containing protein [Oscillospiraceae bacterium]MBQ7119807.1 helix-turn-helix domain-containing protein [Oscillospiraceae bacterium]
MTPPMVITPKPALSVLPATVGTICVRFNGNGLHFHANAEMYYMLNGYAVHYIGDEVFCQKPGECVFIPPYVPHKMDTESSEDTPVIFSAYFDDRLFSEFSDSSFCFHRLYPQFEGMKIPLSKSFSPEEKEEADILSRDALSEFSKGRNVSFEKLAAILSNFLRLLCSEPCEKKLTKTLYDKTVGIRKATKYMAEHYSEKIHLSDLCSVSIMSRSRFVDAFKNTVGMSTGKYLHILRLSLAESFLIFSKSTVDEIAKQTGLYNKSRLTSAFSEYFGTTPAKYRKEHRPTRLLEDLETRNRRSLNDDLIEHYKSNPI